MRLRLIALTAAGLTLAGVSPLLKVAQSLATPTQVVTNGGVTATVSGASASLANERIRRTWRVGSGGGVVTTSITDEQTGRTWATSPTADFALTLNGLPTTSATGWRLLSLTAAAPPVDPSRPAAIGGAELVFRFERAGVGTVGGVAALRPAVGVILTRTVVLRPGSAVLEAGSTLTNGLAVPSRITAYALDQVGLGGLPFAETLAYHGGSDWRDDYRVPTTQPAIGGVPQPFDAEGEVVRAGLPDQGVFLVTERRGGVASRVSRDAAGVLGAGVDFARDAFDFGPILTSPPNYNRQDNPVYPVPVRSRLIAPGASMDLGRAFTGVYSGGAQEAGVAFATDFSANAMPAFARSIGQNSFHPWSHGTGMSDYNLRKQVVLAKALGVETYMLDDQWQGGPGGESGDWHFDPVRFPDNNHNGIPDFVEFLHGQGMKLALWMSIANFNKNSTAYKQHRNWACAPTGDVTAQLPSDVGLGVWDLTNPALRRYLTAAVDRVITTYDVVEIKLDFQSWVDCAPHDYLDAEAAFVSLIRGFQVRHPNVTFELDETNDQRAWPFESAALGASWFDNGHLHGSTAQAKLLHDLWSAAPWLPTSSIGMGMYDGTLTGPYTAGYLAPLALLSHLTFWTDQTQLTAAQRTETSWWLSWYAANRGDLSGAAYELTGTDPLDGRSPMVLQPWAGDHGELFAFWQSSADPVTVKLGGVHPSTTYQLVDVRTGTPVRTATGAALRAGLTLTSAGPYSAQVLTVRPLGAPS